MKSHFEVRISQGEMTSLTCPEQKCDSQALPNQVKALVSDKNFQLYEQVLLSTTLESMADIVLCPRKDCQCPTIIDREANMGQCANCTFVFCIYCKVYQRTCGMNFHNTKCIGRDINVQKIFSQFSNAQIGHDKK